GQCAPRAGPRPKGQSPAETKAPCRNMGEFSDNLLDRNFQQIGKLIASMLDLYQRPDGGLLLVEATQARAIDSARGLAPLLIATVRIAVTKNGKYAGEKPSDSVLNNMLRSRSFLSNFRLVQEVVTTPVVQPDSTPSTPGFNARNGILYLGPPVTTRKCVE